MTLNAIIFIIVFILAIALFAWSCYMRFRLVAIGKPDNRFDRLAKRIWDMIFYAIIQRCVLSLKYRFGVNHFIFFWCFLILLIANAEFLLHGLAPDYISLSRLPQGIYHALALIFDVVSILALAAVLAAIVRRLFFPPKYIEARKPDAFIILGLVGMLMIAFFGLHGGEVALGEEKAAQFMPVSGWAASFYSGAPAGTTSVLVTFFWWLHAIVLLGFLNYLPHSKHMHILTSIPNCVFKSQEKVTTQPREEFTKGAVFGAGQVDQFRWKDLFDTYSCTECGRCNDNCPATITGKELNPRVMVHDIKANLLRNGPAILKKTDVPQQLIGDDGEGSVSEHSIWACTTCGACMDICPVYIEHVPKIVSMRRHLVEMEAKFPPELLNFFENMEQRSNPWGMAPGERTKWATDVNAKPYESGNTEYLFFVGCAGAFDNRSKRSTVALAHILDAAGISWGILGKDELCCGDSLRRLGNEYVFDQIAKKNLKLFQEKGIKKVITQCPHCFNTLKNDYRQYGMELEVIHSAELISRLIKEKRLPLDGKFDPGKVIFHDSCYLGRYNSIYREPREVITAVTGQPPTEMKRKLSGSFCCGAGGGRMWMEESEGKRINIERVQEALAKEPETICVCCPYCLSMFEDGLKDENAGDKVQVLELSEMVSCALNKEPIPLSPPQANPI
jgi:Fe-S oxidoreductase